MKTNASIIHSLLSPKSVSMNLRNVGLVDAITQQLQELFLVLIQLRISAGTSEDNLSFKYIFYKLSTLNSIREGRFS